MYFSDHLPVLAKFSIYLTIPSFNYVDKILNKNISGNYFFSEFKLAFNFTELFNEIEIGPKFPFQIKLSAYYSLLKEFAESEFSDVKVFHFIIIEYK